MTRFFHFFHLRGFWHVPTFIQTYHLCTSFEISLFLNEYEVLLWVAKKNFVCSINVALILDLYHLNEIVMPSCYFRIFITYATHLYYYTRSHFKSSLWLSFGFCLTKIFLVRFSQRHICTSYLGNHLLQVIVIIASHGLIY
jgi:hypothetical protein